MTLQCTPAHAAAAAYYEGRLRAHGATPWGVDWTCVPTQHLRFIQLLKLASTRSAFSINDLGRGYGALLAFLRARFPGRQVDYRGIDVSRGMIESARDSFADDAHAQFSVGSEFDERADYTVASGVFNVQLGFTPRVWRAYVKESLAGMARASRIGFAVNFILPARPGVEPLHGLYRTRAATWAAFCRAAFAADVDIVQGYGLREFTLLARLPSQARRGAPGRVPSSRRAP
jgi:SAM-dependent methyltransferase